MKVAFLDRDGVINVERGEYTWRASDFEFTSGLFEALHTIQNKGYAFVVITNQGGIARDLYSHKDVETLNDLIRKRFHQEGLKLLDIYYSPYHDQISESLSRKPDSLMLEKAIAQYKISVNESFMIGDSPRDILAAEKAGVKGIKIDANQSLETILDKVP
jgi:D-glycero-D-manno-heptose 1,7-bisphosphate phosphatase